MVRIAAILPCVFQFPFKGFWIGDAKVVQLTFNGEQVVGKNLFVVGKSRQSNGRSGFLMQINSARWSVVEKAGT